MQRENKWQERFDEKFCSLYGNKVYVFDRNKGEHILYNSENDAEKLKSFIQSEIDTAIAERDKEIVEKIWGLDIQTEQDPNFIRDEIINLITKQ